MVTHRQLPEENVQWTELPRLVSVGVVKIENWKHPPVFVACRDGSPWAVVNWSGHDAYKAQAWLRANSTKVE
jgi:hypothetical protein